MPSPALSHLHRFNPSHTSVTDEPPGTGALVAAADEAGEDVQRALAVARRVGSEFARPPTTAAAWAVMVAIARANLTVARVVEPHLDALTILTEAGVPTAADDGRVWGVFAAEGPEGVLEAATGADTSVTLTGVKPWCSLGGVLDAALVTAHVPGGRQLFAVDLRHPGVLPEPAEGWMARGLRTVTSCPVGFTEVPATAVGGAGWYLDRPGFAWGGIRVAACWFGGALGVADTLQCHAARHAGGRADALWAMHLGAADAALHAAGTALEHAAARIDTGDCTPAEAEVLALRTRAVVADAVERVLHHAGHALGPAPLAFDAAHAARVADLTIYVRQHHGERDLAALGTHGTQSAQRVGGTS